MEQKNTKYLLALTLVAIWGLLGFRVFNKMNPPKLQFVDNGIVADEVKILEKDSLSLLVNYPDPFLTGKLESKVPINVAAIPRKTFPTAAVKVAPKKKQKIVFPKLSYKGNVKLKNGRNAALVNIEGQIMNLGLGEKYESISLVQIYEDSIQINFNGHLRTYLKVTN